MTGWLVLFGSWGQCGLLLWIVGRRVRITCIAKHHVLVCMASMWHTAPIKRSGKFSHRTSTSDVQEYIFTNSFRWLVFPCFHVVKGDQTSKERQFPKLKLFFTNLVSLIYSIPGKREMIRRWYLVLKMWEMAVVVHIYENKKQPWLIFASGQRYDTSPYRVGLFTELSLTLIFWDSCFSDCIICHQAWIP